MTVSDDRWTCPACRGSVVVCGSDLDVKAAIVACQLRHNVEHREAARLMAHARAIHAASRRPAQQPRRKAS